MRTMTRRAAALIAGAAAVHAIQSCGDSTDPQPMPATPAIAQATPSGDAQTGVAGQALGSPIRVVVTRGGQPAAGRTDRNCFRLQPAAVIKAMYAAGGNATREVSTNRPHGCPRVGGVA